MSALEVRAMMPADLEAVAALARRADPFGWTMRNFQDAMASGYTMTVLEAEGRIVGYFVVMIVAAACILKCALRMRGRVKCTLRPGFAKPVFAKTTIRRKTAANMLF